MRVMVERWTDLFTSIDAPMWEAAHPTPAVVFAGPQALWVFARRSTDALVRRRVSLTGPDDAAIEFPGGVFTSGVAAAASGSGSRIEVVARGTDDRIWRGG
jgi:hypothetical protein